MILENAQSRIVVEELSHGKLINYGIVVCGLKDTWRDPWLLLALMWRKFVWLLPYLKHKPPTPDKQLIINLYSQNLINIQVHATNYVGAIVERRQG